MQTFITRVELDLIG